MRTSLTLVLLFVVLAIDAGGAGNLERVLDAYVAAFNARDGAQVTGLYAEAAELMPPDAAPITGRTKIEMFYAVQFKVVRILDMLSVNSEVSGPLAILTGRLTVSTRT